MWSIALGLVIWTVVSWPLPLHVAEGIPASARNAEAENVRNMIPGDHLQLMYHFWLVDDMLSGKTPLFYNLYEFNEGVDSLRKSPGAYYIPFSIIFALGRMIGGRAFGWNLAGFISIWMTFLFTWLLTRRYCRNERTACLAAILGLILPFQWISLFGGSPTGFTMMWIPALLLGLDAAVRYDSIKGGFLAGTAILFTGLTDSHVFFFTALVTPAWCIVALIKRSNFNFKAFKNYMHIAIALAPTLVLGVMSLVYRFVKERRLENTAGGGVRSPHEVSIFSPHWNGLFSHENMGTSNQLFIGYTILAIVIIGLLILAFRAASGRSEKTCRQAIVLTALCVGCAGIVILALGTRGPMDGRFLFLCRKMIPPYSMIRQPAKIFCLMPTFLALITAISFDEFLHIFSGRKKQIACVLLPALIMSAEYLSFIKPTISLVASEQEAYKAVADNARQQNMNPHVLIIPLWPGDSAWASLYEHYVSLYRIRMLNGYSPIITEEYFEKIFKLYESCNKGVITDEQMNSLSKMGINHVIVHEDAFPEKVSPMPVAYTIKSLANNKRLRPLKHSGPIWAFEILPEAEDRPEEAFSDWNIFFPARRWEFEYSERQDIIKIQSDDSSKGSYVKLKHTGEQLLTESRQTGLDPNLSWLVRSRGEGTLKAEFMFDDEPSDQTIIKIDSKNWTWTQIPVQDMQKYSRAALRITLETGETDLDAALMFSGKWNPPGPGQEMAIPAPLFFHAGHTDPETKHVVLEPGMLPAGYTGFDEEFISKTRGDRGIIYGPRMPLNEGTYRITVNFSSEATPGTVLGGFYIFSTDYSLMCPTEVVQGKPAAAEFTLKNSLPVSFNFLYSGKGRMTVENIVFSMTE